MSTQPSAGKPAGISKVTWIGIGFAGLLLFTVATVAVFLVGRSPSTGPGVARPGAPRSLDDWNHAELTRHLNDKGLRLSFAPSRKKLPGPGGYFMRGAEDPSWSAVHFDSGATPWAGAEYSVVVAVKMPTAYEAHDLAGTRAAGLRFGVTPPSAWSRGRWFFAGDDAMLLEIHGALEK